MDGFLSFPTCNLFTSHFTLSHFKYYNFKLSIFHRFARLAFSLTMQCAHFYIAVTFRKLCAVRVSPGERGRGPGAGGRGRRGPGAGGRGSPAAGGQGKALARGRRPGAGGRVPEPQNSLLFTLLYAIEFTMDGFVDLWHTYIGVVYV